MKPLTPKQEKFAQNLFSGMSQADAYRDAFGQGKYTDKTLTEAASRLSNNSNVIARVKELQQEMANKALWTREESVQALKNVLADGKGSEVVSAVKELNSMHGYNAPIKIDADVRATINIFVPEQSEDE